MGLRSGRCCARGCSADGVRVQCGAGRTQGLLWRVVHVPEGLVCTTGAYRGPMKEFKV